MSMLNHSNIYLNKQIISVSLNDRVRVTIRIGSKESASSSGIYKIYKIGMKIIVWDQIKTELSVLKNYQFQKRSI